MKQKQTKNPFIRTKQAIARINKVINSIKSGIPLLLEGDTGTSKTATAKAAADEIGQHTIIFSFSSQTTTDELIGRISKNTDSWSGFSFNKGRYTEAFENGYCLILDEINLAHENVLQCIEASLDSQSLSLDISGNSENHTIKMHKDFHLIATQNPLSNRFSQKRNYLSNKFTSRFQIINFGEIEQEEMIEIATGLSKNIDLMTPTLINQIVQFHYEWQRNKFSFSPHSNADSNGSNTSYYVFTIREILRTFKSIDSGLTPFESILVNYGTRYKNESKSEMKKLLSKIGISMEYQLFKQYHYIQEMKREYSIGENMIKTKNESQFYISQVLKDVFTSSFHLLESCQSIMLVGPDGCGKTSIGRWIGELFSTGKKNKFFICNPEMTIADVIGRYVPFADKSMIEDSMINNPQIEWMYGPVVKAMIDGDCLILDQIDTAPSTILERLNSLFDGIGTKGFKFPVQENLENKDVIVDPKFRIIAISSQSGLRNLSPAFLNRFTIIYIDEQLDTIKEQLPDWIKCVIPISKAPMEKSDLALITESITKRLDKENKLTSSNLSKCVKGYFKLKDKFKMPNDEDKKSILDFCLDACIYHTSTIPKMSNNFIKTMLNNLDDDINNNSQFDTFHFKEAKSTRDVMATLVACSIIGLHVILIGKTGLGKTSAAKAFSRTNKLKPQISSTHIISFNGETQLDELYGYFTIEKGKFSHHQGELSQAMSEGQVFIADELNLADSQIIQSLNVAIEPSSGESIILPVTGSSVTVEDGFFFIGCQNDLTMNGRKPIPESIKKKILCIKYPEPSKDDFTTLCVSIAKQFSLDIIIPECTASLIYDINSKKSFKSWSLREIRILFRRIAYFQNKSHEYSGFTPIHTIAIMLTSSYKGNIEIIKEIIKKICKFFNKYESDINEKKILNDITSKIKVEKYLNGELIDQSRINSIKEKQDSNSSPIYTIKLKKGSLEMTISNAQLFFIPDNIQQLWQTVFEIYLTHHSEPLLLIGPSGFKTYLAGLISALAPIIYLHNDSTVSSLIGQITLLDRHQAKLNLLESIFDLAGHNFDLKTKLNKIRLDLEENDSFNDKTIDSLLSTVKSIKESLPDTFTPIIENVANHLIKIQKEDDTESKQNGMFSKYISLFKPGLITRSILSQNSLILKNFAQPSPAVIERFNELLSVTPTLTLFEDTSNTFTTPDNNKMYGFSSIFRIIGICLPHEKRNLSDAMLSRLTQIHVPEYLLEEQENVFKTYMENDSDDNEQLNVLKKSLEIFESNNIHVSFRQKIKIIQVANQWQKKFPEMDILTIYMISILRCVGGPLPFELKQKIFALMKDTFNSTNDSTVFPSNLSNAYILNNSNEPYSDSFKYTMENSCLILADDDSKITSTLTNFSCPNLMLVSDKSKEKTDLRFSYSNLDLADLIFSFSIINFPLIIEGPNGCGKSSVFFYIAKYLDIKVIQISISRSTTVEDLFGRYEPISESESVHFKFKPTEFLNAIDNNQSRGEKYWILIEELHLASPSVIDALEPIFNPQSDHITLPDGSFVQRGNFFIVGLLSKPLQKQSILNKVLYYVVRNYTKNEFYEISKFILEENEFKQAAQRVCPIFAQLYEISSSSQIKVPITLREAHKFIKMMKSAVLHSNQDNIHNPIDIAQMLLLGRFYEEDLRESIIQSVNEDLQDQGFPKNVEIPEFSFRDDYHILVSKKLKIDSQLKDHSSINEINHLSKSQRQFFEFLILNIDKYTPIAVQGPTASGKTYTIQLFANTIGKNLRILQLNSEINGADIAGYYCPSKDLSKSDIDKLQNSLKYLANFNLLLDQKFQNKIKNLKIEKWTPSEFYDLKKNVIQIILDEDNDEEDINNAKQFIRIVDSTLLFFNHIERNDSLIIKAMIEGDWLLLDGIESAPSDFLDRLFTLLDDFPTLNLYERGEDQFYSMYKGKNDKSKLIHPDFRLFMTYNPVGTFSNNVSSSFLSRCSLYSMVSIDSNLYDSAIIVLGIIDKSNFTFSNPFEISARIAKIHMKMKEEKQKQLTCRALIHISREICYKNSAQNISQIELIDIIYNHYLQGSQNLNSDYSEFLLNEVKSIFNEKVDDQFIEFLKEIQTNNVKVRNILINIIKNFHDQLMQICSSDKDMILKFKYREFLTNLRFLLFKDYELVFDEFDKIKKFFDQNISSFNKEHISCFASINTIFDLMEPINSNRKFEQYLFLSLDSNQVQSNPDFSSIYFRYQLLIFLHDNNLYLEHIPPFFIETSILNNFLDLFQPKSAQKAIKSLRESKYFTFLEIPENISEMANYPYKWSNNLSFLQQICCSLFKVQKCSFLFTGLMSELFIGTYFIFSKSDFDFFYEWINWMGEFFNIFEPMIPNFNVSFDEFNNQMEKWKNIQEINKKPDLIMNCMNQIQRLQNLNKSGKMSISTLPKIFRLIDELFDNFKKSYSTIIKNNKSASRFFSIKNKIEKYLKDDQYKISLGYLNNYIDLFSQNINSGGIDVLNFIFNSIIKEKKTNNEEVKFSWPTLQIYAPNEQKQDSLIESLISFSLEMNTLEKLNLDSPLWSNICALSQREILTTEFISNKRISIQTIDKYKSLLNAKFLSSILENDSKEFCNENQIISFFNQFIERDNHISEDYFIIAQNLTKKYPFDLGISIPHFKPFDIVSLLVNPLTKEKGPVFQDINVSNELINKFNLLEPSNDYKSVQNEIQKITIEYIQNNYSSEIIDIEKIDNFEELLNIIMDNDQLNDIHGVCQQIKKVIEVSNQQISDESMELDFSDIFDIDYNDFENFLNENPSTGFYLAQFPDIKNILYVIKKDLKKYAEAKVNKFPIGLFQFRIFSGINCINFQLPSTFPSVLAEEFQNIINTKISSGLKNGKINQFSNFIGFLLSNKPGFIKRTNYSEYLRNIIINLFTTPEDNMLKKEIMEILKTFFPEIIEMLGSSDWDSKINQELDYDNSDDNNLDNFLVNPWRFILEKINKTITDEFIDKESKVRKTVDIFLKMILKLSSKESLNQILECVESDESSLKMKIIDDCFNNDENSKASFLYWNEYSKYIKTYFASQIQRLPTNTEGFSYKSNPSHRQFYDFFSKQKPDFAGTQHLVIAIKPSSLDLNLSYNINETQCKLNLKVDSNTDVLLFTLPLNSSLETLNLLCDNSKFEIIKVKYDGIVAKHKETSMEKIIQSYDNFVKSNIRQDKTKVLDKKKYIEIFKKTGQIKVLFGSSFIDDFSKTLNKMNEKYNNFEIENYYQREDVLKDIQKDISELDKFTVISFNQEQIEKPHKTIDFLLQQLTDIISYQKNLSLSNFELFNENYIKRHEIFFNKINEFQKLLKMSKSMNFKPKTRHIATEEEIMQMKKSNSLLTPTIFKNKKGINVTIKEIKIDFGPLLFGVDITPLQIKLCNFTNEEIQCSFNPTNAEELPLLTSRNEPGFLIIEIPVESVCKSSINYEHDKKKQNIEHVFLFEGTVSLSTKNRSSAFAEIKYSIQLKYISLVSFIKIQNKRKFAIKDGKAEIVPFIATQKTQIEIQKITNLPDKFSESNNIISELNDNKANKPFFITQKDEDERISNLRATIVYSPLEYSYLSMNFELGLTKENIIPIGIHIDTFPKDNKLKLSIFSDKHKNFVEKNGIINIGNLTRKIYMLIECLNTENDPLSLSSSMIEINSECPFIKTEYNEKLNKNTIQPNKYGTLICFFEASYFGLPRNKNYIKFKGNITVNVLDNIQKIDFDYLLNSITIQNKNIHMKCESSECYYYQKEDFVKFDPQSNDYQKKFWNEKYQIIVTPFCYGFYDKNANIPKIKYYEGGAFNSLINPGHYQFEVLEFIPNKGLIIHEVKSRDLMINKDHINIFGRIKDKPNSFFPLSVPKQQIKNIFDARKYTNKDVESNFSNYFLEIIEDKYTYSSVIEGIFKKKANIYNYSYIVNAIGLNYKNIDFAKFTSEITNFTKCTYFDAHYKASNEILSNGKKYQYFSFISALNEIFYLRYGQIRSNNFCIIFPSLFKKLQNLQEHIIKPYANEINIKKSPYYRESKKSIEEKNSIDRENIENYHNKGYKITNVLKWTELDGLIPSEEEEINEFIDKKVLFMSKISSTPNPISQSDITNDISKIEFPKIVTIKSLYETFDKLLSETYILPFQFYSLKNYKDLLNQLNQLIDIFYWQENYSACFPFKSFISDFKPAFISMINRLKDANLNMNKFAYSLCENSDSYNFVKLPSSTPINLTATKFTKPGCLISISKPTTPINQYIKSEIQNRKEAVIQKDNKHYQNKIKINKIVYYDNAVIDKEVKIIPTVKNVVFKEITDNTKEIPDTDFIQYLVNEMVKENIDLNQKFEFNPTANKHLPDSIQNINEIGSHNLRIDSFIEASKQLSNTLIKGINERIAKTDNFENNLLSSNNSIYASILVDCSSTLSISQKSALSTLAIALGNTLTSIRIPYSIVIFCESNFQYVLKKFDDNHDLIHFEKLLDSITLRRRMSDISSAILMADSLIKPKDESRTNHSIFILTDGLTKQLKLIEQWKNRILNNPKRSIFFFFYDVLTQINQSNVHPIWNMFRETIKDSISPNAVVFSNSSAIYNGDSIFVKPFIKVLKKFNGERQQRKIISPCFANPITDISDDFLNNIINDIQQGIVDVPKFYAQCSFPKDISEKFSEIDLNVLQLNPLESFVAGLSGEIKTQTINTFLKQLMSYANSLINSSIPQEIGSYAFPLNKPTQYAPSENGSIFYFPNVIKFILTQGQDSKIFLEKKAGLVRSHSVFFVIDNSITCFNASTFSHSFQTIFALLYPFSQIDIPSLNIIITTENGPVVLCSETPSMIALDQNSPLWVSLFTHLSNTHSVNSCLYSALLTVYQIRIQQKQDLSVIFTLTDGCYSFNDRNQFNAIYQSLKATPITIGIGMNPSHIGLMTEKAIWSPNPRNIWSSILFLFGKEVKDLPINQINNCFSISHFNQNEANKLEKYLTMSDKVFPNLFNELNRVKRLAATYRDFYNQNQSYSSLQKEMLQQIDESNPKEKPTNSNSLQSTKSVYEIKNSKGEQYDLGKKDYYKGVNLLIVMCWDYTCSILENEQISEEVLNNGAENNVSVVKALKFFGIQTKIVKSYIDAINELKKGGYSQVWIICGRMDGTMPGNKDPNTNSANLIDAFTECVIKYWHLGGGVVFWTDNYPLTAEVNKFLEKATFKKLKADNLTYDEIKVNFHIGGDFPGEQIMTRHSQVIDRSCPNSSFENDEISTVGGYEKELFNHELFEIFEGSTIASAIKGTENPNEWKDYKNINNFADIADIEPFKPFSKSSSGGFSSLFYISSEDINEGNIIIDCGFSKLFIELTEEGIDRYVKNIAVWMLQIEKKDIKYGNTKDPRLVAPPPFDFNINDYNQNIEFHHFKECRNIDIVFLVDGSNSMDFFRKAVCECCQEIAQNCSQKLPMNKFRYGAVVYRDTVVTEKFAFRHECDQVDFCPLTNEPSIIYEFFNTLETKGGGGDGPEDWVSGYRCLLSDDIQWLDDSAKLVIHICDAPGHGNQFLSEPQFQDFCCVIPHFNDSNNEKDDRNIYDEIQQEQDQEFTHLIARAAHKGLMFFCLNNHKNAMYCLKQVKNIYYQNNGIKFMVQNQFYNLDQNEDEKKSILIENIKGIVISALDLSIAVLHQTQKDFEKDCSDKFDRDFNEFRALLQNRLDNRQSYYSNYSQSQYQRNKRKKNKKK